MRGRILFTNPTDKTGMILGINHREYQFILSDWNGPQPPRRNQDVSFNVQGNNAVLIQPYSADYVDHGALDGEVLAPDASSEEIAIPQTMPLVQDHVQGARLKIRSPTVLNSSSMDRERRLQEKIMQDAAEESPIAKEIPRIVIIIATVVILFSIIARIYARHYLWTIVGPSLHTTP